MSGGGGDDASQNGQTSFERLQCAGDTLKFASPATMLVDGKLQGGGDRRKGKDQDDGHATIVRSCARDQRSVDSGFVIRDFRYGRS